MKLKYVKKNKKTSDVIIDVTTSREERKLIRDYYGRKKCTVKLIQRAVIEACENYVKKYGKKLKLKEKKC